MLKLQATFFMLENESLFLIEVSHSHSKILAPHLIQRYLGQ